MRVLTGSHRDYAATHPSTALLVVEVSESSLAYDRREKASLYARAAIADYWFVNLIDNRLEIRRNPIADESQAIWLWLF